jgi:hypothetical protein
MKKVLVILIILLLTLPISIADAADIEYKGRTHNVTWAASVYDDGTACTACTYYLYIKNKVTGVQTKVGETTQLTSTITLPLAGSYWAGVDARDGDVGAGVATAISWSNMPEVVSLGETWFLTWTKTLQGPKSFKHQ